MLPLWIIDITKQSKRRDAFLRLVGQIEHVYFASKSNAKLAHSGKAGEVNNIMDNNADDAEFEVQSVDRKDSLRGRVRNEDERRAARNAKIKGYYWFYSNYEMSTFFREEDIKECEEFVKNANIRNQAFDNLESIAKCVYKFQEALIRDAKRFVLKLRESNAKPSQPINIVVLGDATESFTQLVYTSIAPIIQKEKGRFLAGHIYQGMNIIGMLYVPCYSNAMTVDKRERMLRLFREIDVQSKISSVRGYDNMMLYQDVQNRAECTYGRLDYQGQAEYLVQCLVHLYLACDINHPLLSGTGVDDVFYFSMGATSMYFDMAVSDKDDANYVAKELIRTFKEEGDGENKNIVVRLYEDESLYSAHKLVEHFKIQDTAFSFEERVNSPRPHPVKDWLNSNLKQFYYQYYLRFYPADLLRNIMQHIEDCTNESLEAISIQCKKTLTSAQIAIPAGIERIYSKVNKDGGALAYIESRFKNTQEYFSKQKGEIQRAMQEVCWHNVIETYKDESFNEYHDIYRNDIKAKNSGAGCNSMKQEVLAKLKNLLSKEQTLSATIARCAMLGLICIFAFLPILEALSPEIINLGRVENHRLIWGIFLFIIPCVIQCLILQYSYLKKKRQLIHKLKMYYIHDGYARMANRVESEVVSFYDKMIALMEEYLTRCKTIRSEIDVITPDPTIKLLFPESLFNQPLNGGEFDGEPLIPKGDVERRRIKVNGKPEYVNNLSRDQYYILINHFRAGLTSLFANVALPDSHARRYDETQGDYVFVSREDMLEQQKKAWEDTKASFNTMLHDFIKSNMCERMYPTLGQKLNQHCKKTGRKDTLEYMVAMAATNGEFATQSDTEYIDVKSNVDVEDFVLPYLSRSYNAQVSQYDELFKRYLFITRWRIFNDISLNRLLPKEDFDVEEREILVFVEEEKAKQNKNKKDKQNADVDVEEEKYQRNLSSLIMWSVCPSDNSNEWLKLFQHFNEAYKDRRVLREVMNQND